MTIRTHTCVIVECNGCGTDWWDDGENYVVHYDTEARALDDVVENLEWRVTEDGQHWCPRCAARKDCERNGHLMSSWQTCWCKYDATAGEPTCGHLWRRCEHCNGAYERRSFDVIPTL